MRTTCPQSVLFACVVTFAACSTASYVEDADREVAEILGEGALRVLGDRQARLIRPEPEPEPAADPAEVERGDGAAPAELQVGKAEIYDLDSALRQAVKANREFLSRRESLYQQGLSYSLSRFSFGPQLNATVSGLWSSQDLGSDQSEIGGSFGVSQILPTGGTLSLTSSANAVWPFGSSSFSNNYSSSVGASLRQPLLRGAGYEASHEGLTQAERGLVYSIREFELFRENFTITVARTFFSLVSQQQTLAIEDTNYQGAVFDRRKAEALHQVDRNTEQEVFRSRRREIEAQDALIAARASYDRALDEFKILLGLPTTALIDVVDVEPPYESVRVEEKSAVAAARHNRLDIQTQREQVEDSERALRLAENGLLPNLDLTASYRLFGSGPQAYDADPDIWSSSVGLNFEIPLQRKSERNSYRFAQIALEQARRGLTQRLDQLDLEVRDALRNLKSIEDRIELQREQIVREQGAVTVSEIRYESGKLDNRDLLEARQALVNAQNALIRLKVDHFIARLSLLRDMGLFFVDGEGMWQ